MFRSFLIGQVVSEQIHADKEIDRHAFWERSDLDRVAAASHQEREESMAEAYETAETSRDIGFWDLDVAVDGGPVDTAHTGAVLVRE